MFNSSGCQWCACFGVGSRGWLRHTFVAEDDCEKEDRVT